MQVLYIAEYIQQSAVLTMHEEAAHADISITMTGEHYEKN